MSEFIEWRGNIFQKDKVLGVTLWGQASLSVKLANGSSVEYNYNGVDARKAAMDDWREVLIGPKPMPVLVGGEPMEDDKTDYKSLYEKELKDNVELQLEVDRLEALIDGDNWI